MKNIKIGFRCLEGIPHVILYIMMGKKSIVNHEILLNAQKPIRAIVQI